MIRMCEDCGIDFETDKYRVCDRCHEYDTQGLIEMSSEYMEELSHEIEND